MCTFFFFFLSYYKAKCKLGSSWTLTLAVVCRSPGLSNTLFGIRLWGPSGFLTIHCVFSCWSTRKWWNNNDLSVYTTCVVKKRPLPPSKYGRLTINHQIKMHTISGYAWGWASLWLKSCYHSWIGGSQSDPISISSTLLSQHGHLWLPENKMAMALFPNSRLQNQTEPVGNTARIGLLQPIFFNGHWLLQESNHMMWHWIRSLHKQQTCSSHGFPRRNTQTTSAGRQWGNSSSALKAWLLWQQAH